MNNFIIISATVLTVLFVITIIWFFIKEYKKSKNKDFPEKLSERIYNFVKDYALINQHWDRKSHDDKYTETDVYEMLNCAELLKKRKKPKHCLSIWESGGYKLHNSNEGKKEHDYLLNEIYKIINS